MVNYQIYFSKAASKDKKRLKQAGLEDKTKKLLKIIALDSFQSPPSYKKLVGNMDGLISRRINLQHRLVYKVNLADKYIQILRMWSHYE